MSGKAQNVIEQFYENLQSGNFEGAMGLMSDSIEIIFYGPPEIPMTGTYLGKDGIARFFDILGQNIELYEFVPTEFIAEGNQVAVIGRERSKVRNTGKVFDVNWVQVWDVENNKIMRLRDFFDTASMVSAFS